MSSFSAPACGAAAVDDRGLRVDRGRRLERRTLGLLARSRNWMQRPEGPLVVLFAGFPLWWVLGLSQVAIFAASAVMAIRLLRWRRMLVPAGFRVWMLFLVWVLLGAFVVQATAPGTVTGDNPNRYLTWALRLIWYLEATVVLLYLTNVRKTLPPERLIRALATMFLTITFGGLAGSLAPMTAFRSLAQIVLPGQLTSNAFVSSFIHPVLAQRMVYLGETQYRPSAPFPYANEWGLNYACFLPLFVHAWCRRSAGWRRVVGPVVLLVSVVPVIYSLNRGLWAVLIVMVIVTVVKHARQGHVRPVVGLVVGATIVAVVIALSPLGTALSNRFTGHNSNEGRTRLSLTSVAAVAQSSPVVGLGTTRDVQGSFYSIAGGSTPSCPSCSPPSYGTQGFFWLLVFGDGIVGGLIGLSFFVVEAWRHRRRRDPAAVACFCSLLAFLLTVAIYDWSETASFAVMASIAILGGMASDSPPDGSGRMDPGRLRPMPRFAEPRLMLICGLIGLAVGAGVHFYRGATYSATASVYLPVVEGNVGLEAGLESTLDTQAQFISGHQIADAISGGVGNGGAADTAVSINASPNTRILNIVSVSPSPERSVSAARAAAKAMLESRGDRLQAEKALMLNAVNKEISGATRAVTTIDTTINSAGTSTADLTAVDRLRTQRGVLQTRANVLRGRAAVLATTPTAGGSIVSPPVARPTPQQWNVAGASGVGIGLLIAILISDFRRIRGSSVGTLSKTQLRQALGSRRILGLGSDGLPTGIQPGMQATVLRGRTGPNSGGLCQRCQASVQSVLDGSDLPLLGEEPVGRTADGPGVMLLVCPHQRVPRVQERIERLASANVPTVGIVVCKRRGMSRRD